MLSGEGFAQSYFCKRLIAAPVPGPTPHSLRGLLSFLPITKFDATIVVCDKLIEYKMLHHVVIHALRLGTVNAGIWGNRSATAGAAITHLLCICVTRR